MTRHELSRTITLFVLRACAKIEAFCGLHAEEMTNREKTLLRERTVMRVVAILTLIISWQIGQVLAQEGHTLDPDEVQKGHRLAVTLCAICHVAAPDQRFPPELARPAPSFASIVQRRTFNAAWLTHFMTTTHRGLDKPSGMANPELMDYQIKEIVAYMLSMRK
jgi:mono/diheme cytochrome c family protein